MTAPRDCQAAVVIVTKDRKDELRRAIRSTLEQRGGSIHIVVSDDGSTDGTAEMVCHEFPQVALVRHERSAGYIVRRNAAAALTAAPIIFSIDDDAALPSSDTVAQTLAEFDSPLIGAVAVPFIDVNRDGRVQQRAPDEREAFVTDMFIGTAHALRRELFLKLGGYRAELCHQGEERDYCLRLLDAGYVVRLGRADPIHHFESPQRHVARIDHLGRRNDVLYAWHNVPMPYLPVHLLATTVKGLLLGIKLGRPLRMLHGLASGYAASVRQPRRPVRAVTYRLSRRLRGAGATPLASLVPQLTELSGPAAQQP